MRSESGERVTEKNRKRNEAFMDAIRRMQAGEHARMCLNLLGWNYCDEKRKAAVLDELEELNEAIESAEEAEVIFWGCMEDMIYRIVKDVNAEFGYSLDCDDCCQFLRCEIINYLYRFELDGCDNFIGTCISFLKKTLIEYLGLELSCGMVKGYEYRKLKKSGTITGGRIVFFFGEYSEDPDSEDEGTGALRLPEELVHDPTEDILGNIDRDRIVSVMKTLYPKLADEERDIVFLRFYEGLNLTEIAKRLDIKYVSTVKRKLDSTIKKLGNMLGEAGALEEMRNYITG